MRRIFRNIHGDRIDEIPYILDILKKNPGSKVYVGTDSQKKKYSVHYATVIAVRYGKRGCHYIYTRWTVKRKKGVKAIAMIGERLLNEVEETMATAQRISDNSIKIYQVDFDLNQDERWESSRFVQTAVGWAKGMGYNVSIKPDEQVATKAANNIVNH